MTMTIFSNKKGTSESWKEKHIRLLEQNEALTLLTHDSERSTRSKLELLIIISELVEKVLGSNSPESVKEWYRERLVKLHGVLVDFDYLNGELQMQQKVINHYADENKRLLEEVKTLQKILLSED